MTSALRQGSPLLNSHENSNDLERISKEDQIQTMESVPSTIDKAHIIKCIIILLPHEYQTSPLSSIGTKLESLAQNQTSINQNLGGIEQKEISEEDEEKDERVIAGCFLWDLSMLKEHAIFLHDNHLVPIVLNCLIQFSNNNRLAEICIGIIGNMICVPELCLSLSQREDLRLVLDAVFFSTDDSVVLSELMRTFNAGVSSLCIRTKLIWIEFLSNEKILVHLLFILQNTLSSILMERIASLLFSILYCSIRSNLDTENDLTPLSNPSIIRSSSDYETKEMIFSLASDCSNHLLDLNFLPIIIDMLSSRSNPDFSSRSPKVTDLMLRILEIYSGYNTQFSYFLSQHQYVPLINTLLQSLISCIQEEAESNTIVDGALIVFSNLISIIEQQDKSLLQNLMENEPKILDNLLSSISLVGNDTSYSALWNILYSISLISRKTSISKEPVDHICNLFSIHVQTLISLFKRSSHKEIPLASETLQIILSLLENSSDQTLKYQPAIKHLKDQITTVKD